MRKRLRKLGLQPNQPPQENKDSCDMFMVADSDEVFDAKPGAFFWSTTVKEVDGIEYRCRTLWHKLPSGDIGAIPIEPVPDAIREVWKNRDGRCHTWTWDGNEQKPTLQPSVHLKGKWHGYFRAGRMESCR